MSQADEVREQQRQTWNRFSDGWIKWDDLVQTMLGPVGAQMIKDLDVVADGNHLDVAGGTGEPGLSIAERMPRGRVVITDLAGDMLVGARENAAARELTNVEIRECSVDDLPFDDNSFDTISCRFGFMFFPDIPAAVNELKRVLKPGGRISTSVWAEPKGNPWATIPMAAIQSEIEVPIPSPDAPSLFRFATPDVIGKAFRNAGLNNVEEVDVRGALEAENAEEYWDYLTDVVAPVVSALAGADTSVRERVQKVVVDQVRQFERGGKLSIPVLARCIKGTK